MKTFTSFFNTHGKIAELDRNYPSYLSAFCDGRIGTEKADTHFGYVSDGSCQLVFKKNKYELKKGHYFCVPGESEIIGGEGIIVSRENYTGMFILGFVENEGRLKYIDGCMDSVLVNPVKMGDPCLNALYFPSGIDQTAHTHPSDRIGQIISGSGVCHTWDGEVKTETMLKEGMIFCIKAEGLHKFSTPFGEPMTVLAYHPDSDFGAIDENHPMINRTIVNGVSASTIEEIRTA